MKCITLAWWFETPAPLPLSEVLKRLGDRWMERDCAFARDSISGRLTRNAWARIFKIGLTDFKVNLTVEVKRDLDLEARVEEAKQKLFREVLPLLNAHKIEKSPPEDEGC